MSMGSDQPTAGAQTVTAALDLLQIVALHPHSSLSELARLADNSLNRTFRLLVALEAAGFVQRDRHKTYRLGSQLSWLGRRAGFQDPLLQVAEPLMAELAQITGQTVSVAVRIGLERILISQQGPPARPDYDPTFHDRLPLYWGALGCCLLAFAPNEIQQQILQQPLQAFSEQTITDPNRLAMHLQQVRQQRYDLALEPQLEVFSVAAPVLDHRMQAVAAIGLGGCLERLDAAAQQRYPAMVRSLADQIALRLAGR